MIFEFQSAVMTPITGKVEYGFITKTPPVSIVDQVRVAYRKTYAVKKVESDPDIVIDAKYCKRCESGELHRKHVYSEDLDKDTPTISTSSSFENFNSGGSQAEEAQGEVFPAERPESRIFYNPADDRPIRPFSPIIRTNIYNIHETTLETESDTEIPEDNSSSLDTTRHNTVERRTMESKITNSTSLIVNQTDELHTSSKTTVIESVSYSTSSKTATETGVYSMETDSMTQEILAHSARKEREAALDLEAEQPEELNFEDISESNVLLKNLSATETSEDDQTTKMKDIQVICNYRESHTEEEHPVSPTKISVNMPAQAAPSESSDSVSVKSLATATTFEESPNNEIVVKVAESNRTSLLENVEINEATSKIEVGRDISDLSTSSLAVPVSHLRQPSTSSSLLGQNPAMHKHYSENNTLRESKAENDSTHTFDTAVDVLQENRTERRESVVVSQNLGVKSESVDDYMSDVRNQIVALSSKEEQRSVTTQEPTPSITETSSSLNYTPKVQHMASNNLENDNNNSNPLPTNFPTSSTSNVVVKKTMQTEKGTEESSSHQIIKTTTTTTSTTFSTTELKDENEIELLNFKKSTLEKKSSRKSNRHQDLDSLLKAQEEAEEKAENKTNNLNEKLQNHEQQQAQINKSTHAELRSKIDTEILDHSSEKIQNIKAFEKVFRDSRNAEMDEIVLKGSRATGSSTGHEIKSPDHEDLSNNTSSPVAKIWNKINEKSISGEIHTVEDIDEVIQATSSPNMSPKHLVATSQSAAARQIHAQNAASAAETVEKAVEKAPETGSVSSGSSSGVKESFMFENNPDASDSKTFVNMSTTPTFNVSQSGSKNKNKLTSDKKLKSQSDGTILEITETTEIKETKTTVSSDSENFKMTEKMINNAVRNSKNMTEDEQNLLTSFLLAEKSSRSPEKVEFERPLSPKIRPISSITVDEGEQLFPAEASVARSGSPIIKPKTEKPLKLKPVVLKQGDGYEYGVMVPGTPSSQGSKKSTASSLQSVDLKPTAFTEEIQKEAIKIQETFKEEAKTEETNEVKIEMPEVILRKDVRSTSGITPKSAVNSTLTGFSNTSSESSSSISESTGWCELFGYTYLLRFSP